MPPLGADEALEVAKVASACGQPIAPAIARRRPFRAPHHTISTAGLVGGGNPPRAGEVTLAHRGVLFLDELPEFERSALEALRQPLEDGSVRVTRVRYSVELPCRIQLLAAANPCPCGHGSRSGSCTCDPVAVRAYEAKLTGALADRIDISALVAQPDLSAFKEPGEGSPAVRRAGARGARAPARPHAATIAPTRSCRRRRSRSTSAVERMLVDAGLALGLSGRGRERVIRLARTIADLDDSDADRDRPPRGGAGAAAARRSA